MLLNTYNIHVYNILCNRIKLKEDDNIDNKEDSKKQLPLEHILSTLAMYMNSPCL
jgi:hypothetical protein